MHQTFLKLSKDVLKHLSVSFHFELFLSCRARRETERHCEQHHAGDKEIGEVHTRTMNLSMFVCGCVIHKLRDQ